jgi:hypothetical protein
MFRATILPIFRSTRLCDTACGIMYPVCCRPVVWNLRYSDSYVCMYVCMYECMYVCIYIYIYNVTSSENDIIMKLQEIGREGPHWNLLTENNIKGIGCLGAKKKCKNS